MQFELNETQQMIRETAANFADREVMPGAAARDESQTFPSDLLPKMAELGFMGIAIPEDWGGAGMDYLSYVLLVEEISRGCASTGVTLSAHHSLYCDPVLRYGTDAQREQWLRPFAQGEKLGCFALSEPGSGSDAAGMLTTATRDGDEWVLNGSKNWITNAPAADACIVFAVTDRVLLGEGKGHPGISAFIVPIPSPGLTVAPHDKKLGIRGSWSSSLFFEDLRLPADALLGEEGKGFKLAMTTLNGGRLGIAAQAIGIAQAAFAEALQYSQEREAFGKPIAALQAIQFMLADMATEIDAARMLMLAAAWKKDQGMTYLKDSAMAKLYASEMAGRVTDTALQIHGGYGYIQDFPAERHLRDARITRIYEGTSEVQRIVIARAVLRELAV